MELPLTNGGVTVIDDADTERIFCADSESGQGFRIAPKDLLWRCSRTTSGLLYAEASACGSTIKLHRLLMEAPSELFVDHRDGDGLNNVRTNLRLATNRSNQHNAKRRSDNTSGFKGVSFYGGCFRARIKIPSGKLLCLGGFAFAEDAARAYDAAALLHFGEFARLNFPQEPPHDPYTRLANSGVRCMTNLNDIEKLLARSPAEIFGADIDSEERRLLAMCHPDLHDNDPKAGELFKRIQSLAEQARHPVRIKGKRHEYGLGQLLATGDVSDVYLSVADGKDYLLKASRVPDADALLLAESESLATIHAKAGDSSYRLYFPLLVESLPVRDKFPKRINTFIYDAGFYTLADVLARHGQLDGRHLAWIFKRLLTAVGFANRVGVVHGAVLPEHILISPDNHGLRLVGWGQSVKSGQPVRAICAKHRDVYPPEVLAKKAATAETDIYMAAKCAVLLAGTGMPPQIGTFLKSCMLEGQKMRPGDAWDLLEEFDELLRRLYGPPKFHVLSMTGA